MEHPFCPVASGQAAPGCRHTTGVRHPGGGWPLPQTGPVLWKTKRLSPRTKWLFEGLVRYSRCRCRPGAQGPFAESRERNGHGCQRPSCGHGSGPTGNCMPEMPDCDQPRRASPCASACVSVAAFSSEDGRCHFISVYTKRKQEMRTCRDVPCSNSSCCQSKKGECCVADCSTTLPETKQSRRSAQQRRSGECAHVFRVAFRRKLRKSTPGVHFCPVWIVESM